MIDGRAIDLEPVSVCINKDGNIWFQSADGGFVSLDEAYLIHGTIAINQAMKLLIQWHELQPKKEYVLLDSVIKVKT